MRFIPFPYVFLHLLERPPFVQKDVTTYTGYIVTTINTSLPARCEVCNSETCTLAGGIRAQKKSRGIFFRNVARGAARLG